jgi:hypothetical protein
MSNDRWHLPIVVMENMEYVDKQQWEYPWDDTICVASNLRLVVLGPVKQFR